MHRVRDARGRSVKQFDPITPHPGRNRAEIPPRTLRAITREAGVGLTTTGRILVGIGVLFLTAALLVHAVPVVQRFFTGVAPSFADIVEDVPLFAYVWIMPFIIWMAACQMRSARFGRVMLRHRRCPHCGHDLRGVPVEKEDHATVCPDCGCAWRLDETAPADQ